MANSNWDSKSKTIYIYEIRGIAGEYSLCSEISGGCNGMGSNTLVIAPFTKVVGINSVSNSSYSYDMSKVTIRSFAKNTQVSIFGYKSISDHAKKNIVINYTPAYGGSKQGIRFGGCTVEGDNNPITGYGYEPFPKTLYGQEIYAPSVCGFPTKENNGIYLIYDSNNHYIKKIEVHIILP